MPTSNLAISVRGLSKSYKIAHQEAHVTLAEQALRHLRNGFRTPTAEAFWALKDVSFDIGKGEVVGIIGRNGAGKSTLLKIISRITEPTAGKIELYGRVGSLLEVGTGFHAELTGRENIFLNGAILGMRRKEIEKQFDAIVDFSGVEKFLDTPVKRYSSGMYVRLAFAVAAHLEPEILIVDEVLAVGDASFQDKCLGKMQDVASNGRTVLFVSHNVAAISRLCGSCLLMDAGKILFSGRTHQAISQYLAGVNRGAEWLRAPAAEAGDFSFEAVRIRSQNGNLQEEFAANEPVFVEMIYKVARNGLITRVAIEVEHERGEIVFASTDCDLERDGVDFARESGRKVLRCRIPQNLLAPGGYRVTAAASWTNNVEYDRVSRCVNFSITAIGSRSAFDTRPGIIAPLLEWNEVATAR